MVPCFLWGTLVTLKGVAADNTHFPSSSEVVLLSDIRSSVQFAHTFPTMEAIVRSVTWTDGAFQPGTQLRSVDRRPCYLEKKTLCFVSFVARVLFWECRFKTFCTST